MIKEINFCAGLPRAGSTVLMNILQQNPRIFTTGTDALTNILNQVVIKGRMKEEFQAMSIEQADSAMHGLIQMGAQGWYAGLTNKPIVISKNRGWSSMAHLFPHGKFIAMIRQLGDVAESFDRVNSQVKTLHTFDESLGLLPSMTENEKFHYYFKSNNPILGVLTYDLPKLAELYQKDKSRVLFIRYEDMINDPDSTIDTLYRFLGEQPYKHDLEHIGQSEVYEHDMVYFRERTSHKVQSSMRNRKPVVRHLSNDFHQRVIRENQPFYEMFYPEVLKK